jgi:hypothetical protein
MFELFLHCPVMVFSMNYYFLFFFFFFLDGNWFSSMAVVPITNKFLSACVQRLQQEDTYLWEDDDDR